MIRVVLVDDNAVFRTGMTNLFQYVDDIEVCATAPDGRSGIDTVLSVQPDVALVDLAMPERPAST